MAESLAALGTLEGFLAAVQTSVFGQVVLVFERLATDVAGERALACNIIIIIINI